MPSEGSRPDVRDQKAQDLSTITGAYRTSIRGGLVAAYTFLTSTARSATPDMRVWMLATTTLQSATLVMGCLMTLFAASLTNALTGQLWPLAWALIDLAATTVRLRGIGRINSGRVPASELELEHAVVMLGGLVWVTVFGIGTALMIASGLTPLMMLATLNVAGTVSLIANRNAATPRYGILCMVLCELPFVLAITSRPEASMLSIAGFAVALLFGLCAVVMQNNRLLVRKYDAERALIDIAHSDPLTGLANRKALDRSLAGQFESETTNDPASLTALCLDLDGFKAVNDAHGHAAGDFLLKVVAERLRHAVRKYDEIFRVGGDEFVCVLKDTDSRTTEAIAARIIAALSRPVEIGAARPVAVGVSIGGATVASGREAATLLAKADGALYEAKRSGKNRYHRALASPLAMPTRKSA